MTPGHRTEPSPMYHEDWLSRAYRAAGAAVDSVAKRLKYGESRISIRFILEGFGDRLVFMAIFRARRQLSARRGE